MNKNNYRRRSLCSTKKNLFLYENFGLMTWHELRPMFHLKLVIRRHSGMSFL